MVIVHVRSLGVKDPRVAGIPDVDEPRGCFFCVRGG
jgi:hypothetical protein